MPLDLLEGDVRDHYREFRNLEKYLHAPYLFEDQLLVQIDDDDKRYLIEFYYQFDGPVIREFLGKKLSSKNRKDLDEVADKTGVDLKSCRRQFDNVKRVYKTVEEVQGNAVISISSRFLLSPEQTKNYAAIAFITHHRMETSKKRLNFLKAADLLQCAVFMLESWTCTDMDCTYEEYCLDLDRDFLISLRDCKVVLDREFIDRVRDNTIALVRTTLSKQTLTDLEQNFKAYLRVIVNMAYNLNHTKEFRDFFIDFVEKIVEPMRGAHWTTSELICLLEALEKSPKQSAFLSDHSDQKLNENWARFLSTVTRCASHIFTVHLDRISR